MFKHSSVHGSASGMSPPLGNPPYPTYLCLSQAPHAFEGVCLQWSTSKAGVMFLFTWCTHVLLSTRHSKDLIQTDRQGSMALEITLWLIGIGRLMLEFRRGLNLAGRAPGKSHGAWQAPWWHVCLGTTWNCMENDDCLFIFWGDCLLL